MTKAVSCGAPARSPWVGRFVPTGMAVPWPGGVPVQHTLSTASERISGTLNKSLDAVLRGRFLTPVLPEGRAALGALTVLMKNDCTRLLQMLFLLSPMFLPSCSDLFSVLRHGQDTGRGGRSSWPGDFRAGQPRVGRKSNKNCSG